MKRKIISMLVAVMLVFTLMPTTAFAAETVKTWSSGADLNTNWGARITGTLDSDGVLTLTGMGAMNDFTSRFCTLKGYESQVKTIVIGDGITTIGVVAFSNCSNLTKITIPDSVQRISYAAFTQCSKLQEITIPEATTAIDGDAFQSCSNLKIIINRATTNQIIDSTAFNTGATGDLQVFASAANTNFKTLIESKGYTVNFFNNAVISSSSGISTDVIGIIEPIDLAATATLSTYLAIDPNITGASAFISPTITVKNDCNAPIEAYAISCKASGTAPKVTTNGAKDWDRLNAADTAAFISLGLSGGEIADTYWFADEVSQAQQHIGSMAVGESDQFAFHGAFGRTWSEQKAFKYQMVMKVALKS